VQAVKDGARLRLRPKVMTVATIVASLLPIMWSHRQGAEVMKPLATPVIGGMISSLIHILIVTPVIFLWLRVKVSQRIANTGKLRISLALVPDVSVLFCQSDEIGKSSRFGVFAIAGSRKSQAGDYSNSREKVKRMITHPRYEAGHIAPIIP
jgi:hypothetical protein